MTATATPICVHCRQPCAARFEITRFDAGGTNKGTVVTCSVSHLIAWAYTYGTMQGVQLAYGVKNTVTGLLDSLRGNKT